MARTRKWKEIAHEHVDLRGKYGAIVPIYSETEGDHYITLKEWNVVKPFTFGMEVAMYNANYHKSKHYKAVVDYIELLGCTVLADLEPKSYHGLMLKFHTTFEKKGDYTGFTFRLGGIPINVNEDVLANLFGLVFDGIPITTIMEGYDDEKFWIDLTGVSRNGEKRIKASVVTNEALFVAYKLLACIFFLRDEASKIKKTDR